MKRIIIFITILFTTRAFSQSRELILVIDTLEQAGKYMLDGYSPSVNYGFIIPNLPNGIETEQFHLNKYPNYSSKKFSIHDTSTLYIPISKQGDIIEIKGISKIKSDTLRINKIPFIQNDLSDTTYTTKYWFIEKKDTLLPLLNKTEQKITVSKNKCKPKNNYKIDLIINGKKYSSAFIISKGQGEIMTGTGTKPTNPYEKDGKRKDNVMRFNINSETKHWMYKATIKLH